MEDSRKAAMSDQPHTPELLSGLDLSFIHRVYRTTLILVVLFGVLIWDVFRLPGLLGWLLGTTLSLLALKGLEWSVRRFIQPQAQSVKALMGAIVAKMLLVGIVLVLAFMAALRGWISLLWVLVGFTLPHIVIGLKLIGQKLRG